MKEEHSHPWGENIPGALQDSGCQPLGKSDYNQLAKPLWLVAWMCKQNPNILIFFKPRLKSVFSHQDSWHWVLQAPPQTFFPFIYCGIKMRFHHEISWGKHDLGTALRNQLLFWSVLCILFPLFWLCFGGLRCSFAVPCLFSASRLQTHPKGEIYCPKTPAQGCLRERQCRESLPVTR